MNLSLFLFHLFIGISPLVFLYLCNFLLNILLFWLVKKRRYIQFGILLSGLVIAETLISSICIGTEDFIILHLFVTLIMQIIIPYASIRIRTLIVFLLWSSMIALILINHHIMPIWDLGKSTTVLAFFNIHLALFGTITQLTIGNFIWDIIVKFNQKELEESKAEANTDPLTGLLNRRFANNFFEKLITGHLDQNWCVAMLDVDDFKQFNDVNGHQIGDDILIMVSRLIKTNLRKRDLVFRWGGEEFLILLQDVDIDIAFRVLDELRRIIESEAFEIHNTLFKITVTIGVCPLDIYNVGKSIDTSDRLMYKGKASGKNVVVM